MGQGAGCCRYIIAHPDNGIICAKNTSLHTRLDRRVERMTAKGDNCNGYEEL